MNDLRKIETHAHAAEPNMAFAPPLARAGELVSSIGVSSIRYGLALVIAWIGAMKFTPYEAQAIEGLVVNSPLLSWVYALFGQRGFSNALGVMELAIAALLAFGVLSPRIAATGAALAVGMFVTTLSFLASTPGVFEATAGGFPALTVAPGQFLIKDFVLLAASLFLLGNALKGIASQGE